MESPESKVVNLSVSYVIRTTVLEVKEVFRKEHVSGAGPEAVFRDVSRGWFLLLEDSYEAIHVGHEKPGLAPGDQIEILIRKR